MASASIAGRSDGVINSVHGSLTGDGSASVVNLGFNPAKVVVFNSTDVIRWEKDASMAAANCIKQVAAGTMTNDSTSAILFNGDGSITLSAALGASGKAISFHAIM